MATKFTYDTANRLFVLNVGVTSLDAQTEFYSEAKDDWLVDDDLNKFRFPILSIGGQDIGGGVVISPYYSLAYGWRIQFAAADQNLTIVGNIITVEGDYPVVENVGPYHHQVQYQVSANSLTAALSSDLAAVPSEVWNFLLEGDEKAFETFRLVRAAVLGKSTGAGTGSVQYRDRADSKDRIDATVVDGNRTAVTADPS